MSGCEWLYVGVDGIMRISKFCFSHSIPRSALARCSHGQCSAWTGHEGLTQTEVGRSTTESSSAGLVGVDRPWPAEPPPNE